MRFKDLTEDSVIEGIFNNLSNFLISTIVMATGIWLFRNSRDPLLVFDKTLAVCLSITGLVLSCINFMHGIKKLDQSIQNRASKALYAIIYSFLTTYGLHAFIGVNL